jgi:hypothetical protein
MGATGSQFGKISEIDCEIDCIPEEIFEIESMNKIFFYKKFPFKILGMPTSC